VFTRSILLQLYGARLANLAVWLALMWLAIRVAPVFKLALALLATDPLAVARLLAETVLRKGRSWVYQLIDAHWGAPLAPEILLCAIPLLPALLIALCPPAGLALPPRSRSVAALAAFALAAASLAHTVYRGTQLYV